MTQPLNLANFLLEQQVLGKGLASPLITDSNTGDFQIISGEDNVLQCIEDLLLTAVGERLMNEDFGTIIPKALFENKEALAHVLPTLVVQAINKFETRVANVKATVSDPGINALELNISWTVKSTGGQGSLVFPYYLSPPSGGINNT